MSQNKGFVPLNVGYTLGVNLYHITYNLYQIAYKRVYLYQNTYKTM